MNKKKERKIEKKQKQINYTVKVCEVKMTLPIDNNKIILPVIFFIYWSIKVIYIIKSVFGRKYYKVLRV